MEAAMEVIRWSGLIVALLLTAVVLKEAILVLRTLANIRALAERIRDAAVGISENVASGSRLPELEEPIRRLGSSGRELTRAAGELTRHLDSDDHGSAERP